MEKAERRSRTANAPATCTPELVSERSFIIIKADETTMYAPEIGAEAIEACYLWAGNRWRV